MPEYGKIVWYDLMSTDVDVAKKFYSQLLNWSIETTPIDGADSYQMIKNAKKELGGIVPFEGSDGILSHWITYISVKDINATCELASSLKGQVCVPPTDLGKFGHFAVLKDPQGGVFSPYQDINPQETTNEEQKPVLGSFCHNELLSSDPEGSLSFYTKLLGWESTKEDMGEMGPYWMFHSNGKPVAGMMKPSHPMPRPHWLSYILVKDIESATQKSKELGGSIVNPVESIPNMGKFSIIEDATGAMFGLFQGDENHASSN